MNTKFVVAVVALIGGLAYAAEVVHHETISNRNHQSLRFGGEEQTKVFDVISTNMEDDLVEEAKVVIEDSFSNASSEEGRVNYIASYFEKTYPNETWNVIESFGAIHYYSFKNLYIKKRYNLIWHTFLVFTN